MRTRICEMFVYKHAETIEYIKNTEKFTRLKNELNFTKFKN